MTYARISGQLVPIIIVNGKRVFLHEIEQTFKWKVRERTTMEPQAIGAM